MRHDMPSTRCTVLGRDGEFCDAPSADDVPFPICPKHAARLYRHVHQHVAALQSDPAYVITASLDESRRREGERRERERPVVYYVQIGAHIKIGYTGHLRQRMRAYPPSRRVLAYEPGDVTLERARHRQFRELRELGAEWFKPGPALLRHINGIRQLQGVPALAVPE